MKILHNDQLTIYNQPDKFGFYNLVEPEKVSHYTFTYSSKFDVNKLNEEEEFQLASDMIDLCGITALIAPNEIAEKYYQIFLNHIENPETCEKVQKSMDQWAIGFVALWDYSVYQKSHKLLICAYDDDNTVVSHLVPDEIKNSYQYTQDKALPRYWEKVNLTDIVHLRTGKNFYENGDGAFLIKALHNLDKVRYEIQVEKSNLENNIEASSLAQHKQKL